MCSGRESINQKKLNNLLPDFSCDCIFPLSVCLQHTLIATIISFVVDFIQSITDVLSKLLEDLSKANGGQLQGQTTDEIQHQIVSMINEVLLSRDELAHAAIFDWYKQHKLHGKLIEVGLVLRNN